MKELEIGKWYTSKYWNEGMVQWGEKCSIKNDYYYFYDRYISNKKLRKSNCLGWQINRSHIKEVSEEKLKKYLQIPAKELYLIY